jgi:hypothetical protein
MSSCSDNERAIVVLPVAGMPLMIIKCMFSS